MYLAAMRQIFWISLMTLLGTAVSAQDFGDYKTMLDNAETILFDKPEESIKIADHVLKNSNDPNQHVRACLLNAAARFIEGEYEEAVIAGVEAKKHAESTASISLQLRTTIATIFLLNHLGLDKVAAQYYTNTDILARNLKSREDSLHMEGGKALIAGYKYGSQNQWQKSLECFTEAKSTFEKIPNQILVNETNATLAKVYAKVYDSPTAQKHLEIILKTNGSTHPNNFLKMIVLNQLGELLFHDQKYSKSLESYKAALEISEQLNNKNYQSEISENLSSVYLVLKDTPQFYSYKNAAGLLEKEVEKDEDRAVNAIYSYINNNHDHKRDELLAKYRWNISILAGVFVLLLLIWTFLKYRYRKRAWQYQKFISYIESRNEPKEVVREKETSRGLNIPQETENALILKLKQFEKSKQFTKRDMSLAQLAGHFETNTKYLSEIINTQKGKNFNAYINELRVNYIIDKLKSDDTYLQYKISYLAEESGFSSHSSFATVFKMITGISPTVFIDLMKSTEKSSRQVYEEVE